MAKNNSIDSNNVFTEYHPVTPELRACILVPKKKENKPHKNKNL
jgi:hypothetical protein